MTTPPIAEVVAADSQLVEAECHTLYEAPAFGSFVRIDCVGSGVSQFAVVTRVATGPFDSSRIVQAHRLAPGELEQRKPHLTTLLRTTFQARIVGYGNESGQTSGTPPQPARLHCFVYPATDGQIQAVTASAAFLRTLALAPDVPLEDLLVSAFRHAQNAWGPPAPVVAWGKYLARLLRNDYVTLEGVMQRLSPGAAVPMAPPPSPNGTGAKHPGWERPIPIAGDGDPFVD